MIHFVRCARRTIAGAVSLVFFLSIAALPPASRAASTPSPEQLLAAAVHASDLTAIAPGGWWDDEPQFNDHLDPTLGNSLSYYVVNYVFGKPYANPSDVESAVDLYVSSAAAAADFVKLAQSDRKMFGPVVAGPRIGERSRYMQSAAQPHQGPYTSVRFQSGRYMVRITVAIGQKTPPTTASVFSIAQNVQRRLTALDAGTLRAPALPALAAKLPSASSTFRPVLGTSPANGDWWLWKEQGQTYVVSTTLLPFASTIQTGVLRRYVLAAHPGNVLDVLVMQFKNDDAAKRYFVQNRKENPHSMGGSDTAVTVVAPHGPDGGYSAVFRKGRYGISVNCSAPFGKVSPACAQAIRTMAQSVGKSL